MSEVILKTTDIGFKELVDSGFEGDIYTGESMRALYATDASAYRELPLAVLRPVNKQDILNIIRFAGQQRVPLIPRGAGTSLAGQVVGNGIIMDISRYMNKILELNKDEKWVRVEPGVVLDELNQALEPYGLFFGPETSTSNRCNLGGMVGNNSCGSHSLIYGSTRDHLIELETILSNGTEVIFGDLTKKEYQKKLKTPGLEGNIYRSIHEILSDQENRKAIIEGFPHPDIHRRNTGYALDYLLNTDPFTENGVPFNMCRLLAGSEGTLAVTTAMKLNLVELPPPVKGLVCVHLEKLEQAFEANLVALRHHPGAIEMMDRTVLDLTKDNITQRRNRFFIQGNPEALLLVEFARHSEQEINDVSKALEKDLRNAGYGYHFPVLTGADVNRVWELRKAGLGVLSNMKGDAKPVPVIEDTAVRPDDLPDYMADIRDLLEKHGKSCVYYAHIGTGELHLRPVLNLKDPKDVELFHTLGEGVARLVKKYRGSLSGEHGDGRLRGEFIPLVYGDKIYNLFRKVKSTWDPENILNPGKITDTPRMNESLRFDPGSYPPEPKTWFDFSDTGGFIRAAEKCNGSGDCRKSVTIGGLMCPSYQATRDEDKTTRARANILREAFTRPEETNLNDKDIYQVLDLCLSCKGCKSECPSNVDITRLKAEFLQQYYDRHSLPLRTRLVGWYPYINKIGALWPGLYNLFVSFPLTAGLIRKVVGFTQKRSIPKLAPRTFTSWLKKHDHNKKNKEKRSRVALFVDEFTEYEDVSTGIQTFLLLSELGYEVTPITGLVSGRTFLSKGMLRQCKKLIRKNIIKLDEILEPGMKIIGIEPSALLSFRDEYPALADPEQKEKAREIAGRSFLLEEFLAGELEEGKLDHAPFQKNERPIKIHGHCHQKVLSDTGYSTKVLASLTGAKVEEIPSGCCGMAGSFGFEKEHYNLSMKVGELVLFPEVRKSENQALIIASGTSCRRQILDGTHVEALHPGVYLFQSLRNKPQISI